MRVSRTLNQQDKAGHWYYRTEKYVLWGAKSKLWENILRALPYRPNVLLYIVEW